MTDRVTIVTGGGSGIGRAAAVDLARRGHRVAVLDLNRAAAEETAGLGDGLLGIEADVTDLGSVTRAVERVLEWGGRIDGLVNSAGATAPLARVFEMEPGDFKAMIELHLIGSFHCLRETLRVMVPRGYGRVVLIGSMAGNFGLFGKAHYAAAKAGLRGLVMTAAKEVAGAGVTVNLLTPGLIRTPMAAGTAADRLPGGGRPEDAAAVIGFLLSPEAGHVNGAVITLDGGENLMKGLDGLYAERLGLGPAGAGEKPKGP